MMAKKSVHIIRGEQGQTLLMFVLFMIVLIIFIGLGVDMGFAYITRARLSKAVDSACLTAVRNLADGQTAAHDAATAAFFANYGTSGRDVPPGPVCTVTFNKVNQNNVVDVQATDSINTYFIRVLPQWRTLAVGSFAEATRADVIMGLVLDHSGSMGTLPPGGSGGGVSQPGLGVPLAGAVVSFIDHFDDTTDKAAMSSFGSTAITNVVMEQPFKTDMKNAANAMSFNGRTFSEGGLMIGFDQVKNTPILTGETVVKVVVFFTDGYANVFETNFACRAAAINLGQGDPSFVGPTSSGGPWATEFMEPSGGSDPSCSDTTFPSLTGGNLAIDPATQNVWYEAQRHALNVANQIRSANILIYSIGLGQGLNQDFLKNIANDPTAPLYNPNQISGEAVFAPDVTKLQTVFDTIANKILLRLAK